MTISEFLTMAAAGAGLVILLVMAAIPFLLDPPLGRCSPDLTLDMPPRARSTVPRSAPQWSGPPVDIDDAR